jgi:hypothetical protein
MPTLAMWTVYDSPSDYPGKFVARRFYVDASGVKPSGSIIIAENLETVRYILCAEMGLIRLTRNEEDDPKIVETWF